MAISILDRVSRSDIVLDPFPHIVVADALAGGLLRPARR